MAKISILKHNWERIQKPYKLDERKISSLLEPYCREKITSLTPLTEGCANTNYKIEFAHHKPIMIRIYLREANALMREQALYEKLKSIVPVPQFLYSDHTCKLLAHPYAIVSYMEGDLMRNVILQGQVNAIAECAYAAGLHLKKLREFTYQVGGFFKSDLSIHAFTKDQEFCAYASTCLEKHQTKLILGPSLITAVKKIIQDHKELIPSKSFNLTHGDYDPSNLLVSCQDGHYQISGILDWEFALSGTYLLDMGTFLRYAHHLSDVYENAFINGFDPTKMTLPKHWKHAIKLIDLINLLTLLSSNSVENRPNMAKDIFHLIQHTIKYFENM